MSQKKKEQQGPVTVVDADGIDMIMYDTVRNARKIAEICKDDHAEGVVQDTFTSFFSHDPQIKEDGETVQADVLRQMMALPEYESLRAGTKNDEIASAMGAVSFAPDMIKKIAELRKKLEERQEQARKQGAQVPQNLKEALSDQEMSGLRQSLRQSLEKAQEEADKWSDSAKSWGMEPGEMQKLPFEERMELAEQMGNSEKMKKIADLAGRFKNIVNSSAATVPIHGLDEIVDIGLSSDVAHMLPNELVKLEETPELFYQDFVEGKLLTYNLKGVEPLGRGPILACVDLSGSMEGPREQWAKAVVLALMQLATKQRRSFGFIGFDNRVEYTKFFKKDEKISVQDRIEIAQVFTGGGTEFVQPLMAAFKMREQDITLKPADIIFITDGDAHIPPDQLQDILEKKEKLGMRIYSIAIDCYRTNILEQFSDQVAGVSLNGDVQIDLVKDLVSKAASQAVKKGGQQ